MGIIEAVSLQLNGMRLFDAKLLSPGSYLLWSILLYLIGGIALRTTHAGKFEQESHVDVDQGSNSNSTSGQPHADRHSRNWRLLLCLVVTILVEFKSAIPTYMLQYTSNVFKNPILEVRKPALQITRFPQLNLFAGHLFPDCLCDCSSSLPAHDYAPSSLPCWTKADSQIHIRRRDIARLLDNANSWMRYPVGTSRSIRVLHWLVLQISTFTVILRGGSCAKLL